MDKNDPENNIANEMGKFPASDNHDHKKINAHEELSDQDDKEFLLHGLLSRITPSISEACTEKKTDSIHTLTLESYNDLSVPTETEQKIQELKGISNSIIQKTVDLSVIKNLDFTKFKVNYAQHLNPAQLAATVITEIPVLVIAGAGSGKTRVIVHRVSYLIEKGVHPDSILLLTFTRKAANEMLNRVETLLHDKHVSHVTGGTFHSFASYICGNIPIFFICQTTSPLLIPVMERMSLI